ncbi:MAG: LysR family transcriptional regulator substrate-binding protein, partial [Acidimicrobiales bacterium]
ATLVDRSAGCLTEDGEAVVARARRISIELEAMVADLSALRDEVVGTVRVGLIGTTARWLLPRLLELGAERHPRLHLVAVEGTSTALERQLSAGRLDLAVLNLPVSGPDLLFTRLFEEDLVLVVAAGDPLAAESELDPGALADLELLLPLAGTAFRNEIDAALAPAGVTLTPRAELDGVRLIASMTFEGLGPAILPATAVPSFLRPDWRLVRVRGIPRRRIGVAQRSRGLPSAPARALLALLYELTSVPATMPEGLHPTHPAA